MFDVKAWVYAKLIADGTLQTALGGAGKIMFWLPNEANTFPVLTYAETNQTSDGYYDDEADAVLSTIELHTWTAEGVSTSTIAKAADAVMRGLLFNCDYNGDYVESDTRVNHRVSRYSRSLTAADLV